MIAVDEVAERLAAVRRRIEEAGGGAVTVVAVTKGFGPDAIEAAAAAGVRDIGESYAQELLGKLAALGGGRAEPTVHFIGRLQANKVRQLASVVDLWQTVDRATLGAEIARRSPGARVLVQVNVTGEEHKGGCQIGDTTGLVATLLDAGLVVEGLMAVGPAGDPEQARPGFRRLRRLADELALAECSMGMTDDLEVAVEEGSTMVRVGSALFGLRPVRGARAH